MVVSMASWAPPKSSNPSATTSNLRMSAALGSARSRSRTMTLVVTRPPASRQMRAATVSRAYPLLPKTPARTVVATSVEWKATPAGTHGQGKREMEAAQQDDPEELKFDARDATRGTSGQRKASSRSALRSHKSLT